MKVWTTTVCCVAVLSASIVCGQSSVSAPGDPIHTVSPKYPKDAPKQKVDGPVTLHVTVASDGSVKDATVVSGDSRLTDAALEAVRKWRFQPFTADGKPVEGQRDVTINFTLTDAPPQLDDSTDPLFRAGSGGVTAPRVIYAPDPEYPKTAKNAHVQGQLALALVVGSDGKPRDIMVVRSLGEDLDRSAIEAVKEWRFKPSTKDGKPVAVKINVEVQFHQ